MSDVVIQESGGLYVLPLAGFVCSGLEDGYVEEEEWAHVDLVLHDDPFTTSATVRLSGGENRPLVLALVTRRARVVRMVATTQSALIVEFDQGESFEVPPRRYEAWEVNGKGFQVIASVGGGEPMIWDSRSRRSAARTGERFPEELSDLFEKTKGDDR